MADQKTGESAVFRKVTKRRETRKRQSSVTQEGSDDEGVQTKKSTQKVSRGLKMFNPPPKKESPEKEVVAPIKKAPERNESFIKSENRWDYAPDVCKDYKESGKACHLIKF
jgi:hypothetical protein